MARLPGHHGKFGAFSLNKDLLMSDLIAAIEKGMDDYAEHVANDYRKLLLKKPNGPAGRKTWRKALQQMVKVRTLQSDDEGIKIRVTIDEDILSDAMWNTRAHVVVYGSGGNSKLGGEWLHTKPGELTWHDALSTKRESEAESVYELPRSWNHVGNDALALTTEKAIREQNKMVQRFIRPRIDKVLANTNKYITVNVRFY